MAEILLLIGKCDLESHARLKTVVSHAFPEGRAGISAVIFKILFGVRYVHIDLSSFKLRAHIIGNDDYKTFILIGLSSYCHFRRLICIRTR